MCVQLTGALGCPLRARRTASRSHHQLQGSPGHSCVREARCDSRGSWPRAVQRGSGGSRPVSHKAPHLLTVQSPGCPPPPQRFLPSARARRLLSRECPPSGVRMRLIQAPPAPLLLVCGDLWAPWAPLPAPVSALSSVGPPLSVHVSGSHQAGSVRRNPVSSPVHRPRAQGLNV